MPYESEKQLLARATSFEERQEAVRKAIGSGMPLAEIEAYLDWIDLLRNGAGPYAKGHPHGGRQDGLPGAAPERPQGAAEAAAPGGAAEDGAASGPTPEAPG